MRMKKWKVLSFCLAMAVCLNGCVPALSAAFVGGTALDRLEAAVSSASSKQSGQTTTTSETGSRSTTTSTRKTGVSTTTSRRTAAATQPADDDRAESPTIPATTRKATQAPPKTTKKTTPKTTAAPSLGSENNPIRLGQTAVIDNMDDPYDSYKLQITITDVVRGQEAEDMVMEGSMFNDPAPGSMEYLLFKVKIKLVDSGDYSEYYVNKFDFDVVSQEGVTYETYTFVSGLEPELSSSLYIGEETEGYVPQLVMKGDSPRVLFTGFYGWDIWFSLS